MGSSVECTMYGAPPDFHEPHQLPSITRALTFSCPVLQYTTMLVVPTAVTPSSHGRNIGPIRGDHAIMHYDPATYRPMGLRPLSIAGPSWGMSPASGAARPMSLHFETLPNPLQPIATTPRRAASPVRMSTNPRVRRRSVDPTAPSPMPQSPFIEWPSPLVDRPGPIKARTSRRSSGAKELLQLLKRSAKKKMDRFRRSLSAERLSGHRRGPPSDDIETSSAQRRRISSPSTTTSELAALEDSFPRARLLCIHNDGSHTVRLVRHPCHAFGFFVSLDKVASSPRQSMFVSRMSHPRLEERLSGLLDVGDELLTVENVSCASLTLEQLQSIVGSRLVIHLRVQPRPFL